MFQGNEKKIEEDWDSMESILELSRIKRYFGGFPALQDVSVEVKRGEILGLIGPNGAGKTTLLNVINGIFPPTGGRIFYRGLELKGMKPHVISRLGISRVLQTPRPFLSMTVLENVTVGAVFGGTNWRKRSGSAVEQAESILQFIGLHHKKDLSIEHLNLQEKKMVDVAKALASQPEVLLIDEVMSGLNPSEVEDCMRLIKRLRDEIGVTIIWIEHLMKAIMGVADRVVVLNYGQVIATGSPDQVSQDQRVIDAYLGGSWIK